MRTMSGQLIRRHLIISGVVQGVFYRLSTQEKARNLGLTGWIRNLADGRVEALAVGAPSQVEALILWCQDGPDSARVENVEVATDTNGDVFEDFEVRS